MALYSNPPFVYPEITVYGEAVETFGLEVVGAISGLGLLTHGLLWECGNIYSLPPGVTTTWSMISGVTTTWSVVGASITTVWTDPFGGEC